jgi:hypothetical protein
MSTTVAPPASTALVHQPAVPAPLLVTDRCDRCGAQAWLRATIANVDLLFCGHHANAHLSALSQTSAELHSELDRLEKEHGPNAIREAIAAEESAKG